VPADLPFGPTHVVSFGGSFLNRVTPNNVGGMALNFRYQQKAGIDSHAASAAVGLQTVTARPANLLLLTVFFARTGRNTSVHFHTQSHQWVLVLITAAVVGCAVFLLTPAGAVSFTTRSGPSSARRTLPSPRSPRAPATWPSPGWEPWAAPSRKSFWRYGYACTPSAANSPSCK
jgi:hypothetical protein